MTNSVGEQMPEMGCWGYSQVLSSVLHLMVLFWTCIYEIICPGIKNLVKAWFAIPCAFHGVW